MTLTQHQTTHKLLTGVVIASPTSIRTLIARAIAPSQVLPLTLEPGSISVLHSPAPQHSPILQALNINIG
ncbi:MAG: hypothetical protein VKL39_22145, partial [Leptolyngbyaceae bacterium]|nr:hypothetical protein [Leptolyngbyaceae bacterium]